MAPKRGSKQQQQLNVEQFKLLKKQMDHLGKQINVPGSTLVSATWCQEAESGCHWPLALSLSGTVQA
jgi:hypothetical protein